MKSPRRRRALVGLALLVAAPLALGLRIAIADEQSRRFYPPDRVTVVPKGQPVVFRGVRWRLQSVSSRPAASQPRRGAPGSSARTTVTFAFVVEPVDRAGLQRLREDGFAWEYRDRAGRVWEEPFGQEAPEPTRGRPVVKITGVTVPRPVAASLQPQLRVSAFGWGEREERPPYDPVLRFAR